MIFLSVDSQAAESNSFQSIQFILFRLATSTSLTQLAPQDPYMDSKVCTIDAESKPDV